MTDSHPSFQEVFRKHIVLVFLTLFLVVDILSLSLLHLDRANVSVESTSFEVTSGDRHFPTPPRLSDLREATIDAEAATIVVEEVSNNSLPLRLWIFLLIAYAALLIFNLSFDFERMTKVQWGWETALTLLVLVAWYWWDPRSEELWFPLSIIKIGLLIYASYLYFLDKKISRMTEKEHERA